MGWSFDKLAVEVSPINSSISLLLEDDGEMLLDDDEDQLDEIGVIDDFISIESTSIESRTSLVSELILEGDGVFPSE